MAEIASGTVEEKSNSAPSSPNQKVPTDPEALALAVRMQVEYYFSKENLQSDKFLTSKMDAQKSVPIETVMGFSKLKALTSDKSVVVEALKSSSLVVLESGRIKSIVKTGRSTIILREIPSDASEDSVREIFAFPGCKAISSVRSEIGDTWFVTMESEEDAKDTLMDLKLKKRTFNGVSVKARLKTETVIRSYYPTTQMPAGGMGYPMMPFYGSVSTGADQFNSEYGNGGENSGRPRQDRRQGFEAGAGAGSGNRAAGGGYRGAEGESTQGAAYGSSSGSGSPRRDAGVNRRQGGNVSNSSGSSNKTGPRDRERDNNRKTGGSQGSGNGNGKGRDRKDGESSSRPAPAAPVIEINSSADFPPLPGDDHAPAAASPSAITTGYSQSVLHTTFSAAAASFTPAAAVIPPRGYQGAYTKYSIDDVMSIVTNIKEAILPDTVQSAEHPCAMTTTPNNDLLMRQRTFSIDETREQMQQGRPVHREATIAGDVDYGSLIYGEDTQAGAQGGAAQQKKKASGGSWAAALMKGGDAPPAPPAVQQKKPEPKPAAPAPAGAGAGADKKGAEGGKKKESTPRKEESGAGGRAKGEKKEKGQRGERRARSDSKGGDGPPAQPPSWGGRPTFANVLKEKQAEAEAAAAKAIASPSAAPAAKSAASASSGSAGRTGANKVDANKKPSGAGSAPEGAWGKEKLPPLRDGA